MPERILVVDDEPNMLRLLKTILMDKTGYEVTTTNNPLEVSKLLQDGHYDLVVTDLKMPLVDGIDLIGIVKNIDAIMPIIVITAYGTIETAEEAIQKGAYDFITKPFRKETILITIKRALEWKRMEGELAALPGVQGVARQDAGTFSLGCADAARTLAGLQAWANSRGLSLEHLEVVPATLEDVFLELTGKGLRD
jgi:DNA-binding NtrC family response regulator